MWPVQVSLIRIDRSDYRHMGALIEGSCYYCLCSPLRESDLVHTRCGARASASTESREQQDHGKDDGQGSRNHEPYPQAHDPASRSAVGIGHDASMSWSASHRLGVWGHPTSVVYGWMPTRCSHSDHAEVREEP